MRRTAGHRRTRTRADRDPRGGGDRRAPGAGAGGRRKPGPNKPAARARDGAGKPGEAVTGKLLALAERVPPRWPGRRCIRWLDCRCRRGRSPGWGSWRGTPESERALIAIELCGRTPGARPRPRRWPRCCWTTGERARAEAAAEALGQRPEAAAALAAALMATTDTRPGRAAVPAAAPPAVAPGSRHDPPVIARAAVLVESDAPAADARGTWRARWIRRALAAGACASWRPELRQGPQGAPGPARVAGAGSQPGGGRRGRTGRWRCWN